jgi:thiamine-phosphate pyrophosphorylase
MLGTLNLELRTPNPEPEPRTRTQNMEPRTQNRRVTLHAILDVDVAASAGWEFSRLAQAFLAGGARLIQLRAKQLPSSAFLERADELVALAAPYGADIIVNDRVDIALLARAAGAHVGQEDLPPGAARRLLGPAATIGYSTHTLQQIESAVQEPVTYVAVGPVFGTATKATGYEAVGVELVSHAVRLARGLPVIAIGGITLENAPLAIAAGASGVAVIGDLLVGADPAARVAAFQRALGR